MKLFDSSERRGVLTLVPLFLVVLLLAVIIDVLDKPELIESEPAEVEFKAFDPNIDEYEQLRASGVPSNIAAGIVRWRSYGKVYRIKEDLTQVSGMTDSIYALLKPYITIADSLAPQPRFEPATNESAQGRIRGREAQFIQENFTPQKFLIDTVSSAYLTRWGFSPKQADVVIRYRDASGGISSAEQLRRCYVVSEQMAERIIPYIIFSKADSGAVERKEEPSVPAEKSLVDINTADSAMLVAVDGIGAKSASEIIKYRKLLGGYHSVEQLTELKCITESNFEKILQQICCDSFVISKIDINFAGPKELERHPYVSAQALRRIIKHQKLKGGWSRIEEMTEDNILSEDEAERLAPYLRFGLEATE